MALFGGTRWKSKRAGTAVTPTFQNNANVLTVPFYREHLKDIYQDRKNYDSLTLMKELFVSDPDVSATVNSYLTVSDTEPRIFVYDEEGQLDEEGILLVQKIISRLENRLENIKGFQLRQSFKSLCADLRYMALLRGTICAELVFDTTFGPSDLRNVDAASIRWREEEVGKYIPFQKTKFGEDIKLDIPTFFVSFFRRQPTDVYTTSHFVAAINTIAARQQIINDLYRIMYATGFPRIDIKVVEEVVRNGMPTTVRGNSEEEQRWISARIKEISKSFSTLRADEAFIHTDSIESSVINDRNPGASIDISKVIEVLNGQNQAALKVMSTIIGRGESGVNTASVEARIFALNSDSLNQPVADLLSSMFTFALRLMGRKVNVNFSFRPVELRPWLELENQLTMKQERLLKALSLGIISDLDFHIEMYGRPPPKSSPLLSGTGFYNSSGASVDVTSVSPADPLGRSIAPSPGGN